MIAKQLDLYRRMRASLTAIADLDPESVATRIVETDWEIDRLTALLDGSSADAWHADASSRSIEIVPIGLRAA